ncbi:unnamed protein product [Linum trigynum]|uniref:Retrotransposon gag domain-containing protein n=1 Tax=Linum trigynum TaxID=586398 RepID=A0AAV2EWG1_9ROSI
MDLSELERIAEETIDMLRRKGRDDESVIDHMSYFLKVVKALKILGFTKDQLNDIFFTYTVRGDPAVWYKEFQSTDPSWSQVTEAFIFRYLTRTMVVM